MTGVSSSLPECLLDGLLKPWRRGRGAQIGRPEQRNQTFKTTGPDLTAFVVKTHCNDFPLLSSVSPLCGETLGIDLLLVNKPSVGLQRGYQEGVRIGTTGGV